MNNSNITLNKTYSFQDETIIEKEIRINAKIDDSKCHSIYHQCQRMQGNKSCFTCGWRFLQ